MFYRMCPLGSAAVLVLLLAGTGEAEISIWKIGGSGAVWSGNDTTRIMIDFETVPTAIQPVYLTPERSVFSLLSDWSDDKEPRDLGYFDGGRPRSWWKWSSGVNVGYFGSILVDGDRSTYNPPTSAYGFLDWYTFDLAVPVPVHRFGFNTPSEGFRSDGIPLSEDPVPAYEVSIAAEPNEAVITSGPDQPIGPIIASASENFETYVQVEFPRQYVRFIRYKRKLSELDLATLDLATMGEGQAARGIIAEFELFGEGAPRRVLYMTRILDLGQNLNFGRLFWSATPLRRVDGEDVPAPDAEVSMQIEARTGRNDDPNIYHEFTDKGLERPVSRDRFERELKPPSFSSRAGRQEGKPGLRASIKYDTENWTYWSMPFVTSGRPLGLANGSHIQIKITLESEEFDAFMRLDSLWIERAPLLARRIVGELARQDNPRPERGFTEVVLGEPTDFVYDFRAEFNGVDASGFDAVRIRTGHRTEFRGLEMGEESVAVEPARIVPEEDGLVVHLPQRVTAERAAPVRVVFGAQVFTYAATFEGEVFDTTEETLPQPIEPGDATAQVATSSLRVLGESDKAPAFIQELAFSTPVLTPNGDGVHDRVEIAYSLFRLPHAVPVTLGIYALDGRRAAFFRAGLQASGPQRIAWDGRDEREQLLPPGLYLVDIALRSESVDFHQVRPIGIAY